MIALWREAMSAEALLVLVLGLATALATGLGALPFAFLSRLRSRTMAASGAVAAGLMLGASIGLVLEARPYGIPQTILGGALGGLFVLLGQRVLAGRQIRIAGLGELGGLGASRALLVLAAMTIHSFAEGVAVGVAFRGGVELATSITVAIAVHNIPEGLAISAVMRPRGASILACAGWSIFSSLPQPLMAVPAFLFVEAFSPLLPYGLGFAAGAMVFLVLLEILPESYQGLDEVTVGLIVSGALAAMILFQRFLS